MPRIKKNISANIENNQKGGNPQVLIAVGIFIAIIVCALAYGYFQIMLQKQKIEDNWRYYRCKPFILPFAGWLVGKGRGSPDYIFKKCAQEVANKTSKRALKPFSKNINTMNNRMDRMSKTNQEFRERTKKIRDSVSATVKAFYKRILAIRDMLKGIIDKIKKYIKKILTLVGYAVQTVVFAYGTLASLWNGPIGGAARYFCLIGNTKLITFEGDCKDIRDIEIGSRLKYDGYVLGKLETKLKDIPLYKYNNIIVSKGHLIKEYNEWIRVENSNNSSLINQADYVKYNISDDDNLYCLITSSGKITVENPGTGKSAISIFSDYLECQNTKILELIDQFFQRHINNHIGEVGFYNSENDTNYLPPCFNRHTVILDKNNKEISIDKVEIGDILKDNNKVLGKAKILVNSKNTLYKLENIICSGSTMYLSNNGWIRFNQASDKKMKPCGKSYYYHLITENNKINIIDDGKEIIARDFAESNDININKEAENIVDKFLKA